MSREKSFNLLDFGSSKIRFSVFDLDLKEKFSDKRLINFDNDYSNHFKELINIIKKAEKKISFHIKDIVLLLDTSELFIIDISFYKKFEKKSQISKIYNSLILELTQIINLNYSNQSIIHITTSKYIVDGKSQDEILNHKMLINNLKVDFKVICFPKNLITKLKSQFVKNNINVSNIFCTSYVKALNYQKKLNEKIVSFLDIGWERSSFIVFEKNKLKFAKSIPIGGSHITKDISKVFKISLYDAENIKKSFNKSETEFSYEMNSDDSVISIKNIIDKKISTNLLKKVILYRVQEIIDLIFKKLNTNLYINIIKNSELFLIGEGSNLFNNNTFYLSDKFQFKSIKFYNETDDQICKSGLVHFLNNNQTPKIITKKQGLFEKFFNYFEK